MDKKKTIPSERQKAFDVVFKGHVVGEGRIDFFLGGEVVVELKAVDRLHPKHTAQTIKYLKAMEKPLGLLLNFHEYLLKDGLKRIIYSGD
jgi:GxxExxY protein